MPEPRPPVVHRHGQGPPLVLVHGLGATRLCWSLVVDRLATERQVVTFDLPGFGESDPVDGPVTLAGLTDAVQSLLSEHDLLQADLVGSSMGAEIALELLRRGHGRDVVALAPSGYWNPVERLWFVILAFGATALITVLRPVAPAIIGSRLGRRILLQPLSPRPAELPDVVRQSTYAFATTPSFGEALIRLLTRRRGVRVPAERTHGHRVTVVWGRKDGLCLPRQARVAARAVPGSQVRWLERSGHLPIWDEPDATAELLLLLTGETTLETPPAL